MVKKTHAIYIDEDVFEQCTDYGLDNLSEFVQVNLEAYLTLHKGGIQIVCYNCKTRFYTNLWTRAPALKGKCPSCGVLIENQKSLASQHPQIPDPDPVV